MPSVDNQLTLSDKKDRYGVPLARVTHDFGPDAVKCYDAGIQQGLAIFKAAGASEVWAGGRAQIHNLGGTIVGRSPQTSVTNGYGETHVIWLTCSSQARACFRPAAR